MRPPATNHTRLLFLAGHIPKGYVRPTRFRVWMGLQRFRQSVTVASSDLSCTIGSYAAVCPLGNDFLRSQPHSFYDRFCAPYCNRAQPTMAASQTRASVQTSCPEPNTEPSCRPTAGSWMLHRDQSGFGAARLPFCDHPLPNATAAARGDSLAPHVASAQGAALTRTPTLPQAPHSSPSVVSSAGATRSGGHCCHRCSPTRACCRTTATFVQP